MFIYSFALVCLCVFLAIRLARRARFCALIYASVTVSLRLCVHLFM